MGWLWFSKHEKQHSPKSTIPIGKTMISLGFGQTHMICGSFEAPLVTKRALEAFCFAGCAVSFLEVNEHLQSGPAPLGMPKSTAKS
jgi:hypothetical protein